jgi:hypothetical protein
VENPKPVIEYATAPKPQKGSPASIWIAATIFAFTLFVFFIDDPFQSMGNAKPMRICITAGILGMLVAVKDLSKQRSARLSVIGIVLNAIAMLAALIMLPYV